MTNARLEAIRQFINNDYKSGFTELPEVWPQGKDNRIDSAAGVHAHLKGALRDYARAVEKIEADEMTVDRVKRQQILVERLKIHAEIGRITSERKKALESLRNEKLKRQHIPDHLISEKERAEARDILEAAAFSDPAENAERFKSLRFRPETALALAWKQGTPDLFGITQEDANSINHGLEYFSMNHLDRSDQGLVEGADYFSARVDSWGETAMRKAESVFDLYRNKPKESDQAA